MAHPNLLKWSVGIGIGMRAQFHRAIVAIALVRAADDVALPRRFSFMIHVTRDLPAKIARVLQLLRWSLSPARAEMVDVAR